MNTEKEFENMRIVGITVKPEFLDEIIKNSVPATATQFPLGIPVYVNKDIPENYVFMFAPKETTK
jgi:hypothetical protein